MWPLESGDRHPLYTDVKMGRLRIGVEVTKNSLGSRMYFWKEQNHQNITWNHILTHLFSFLFIQGIIWPLCFVCRFSCPFVTFAGARDRAGGYTPYFYRRRSHVSLCTDYPEVYFCWSTRGSISCMTSSPLTKDQRFGACDLWWIWLWHIRHTPSQLSGFSDIFGSW